MFYRVLTRNRKRLSLGRVGKKWVLVGASGNWLLRFLRLIYPSNNSKAIPVIFTGTFERSLDTKARVLLPKKIRNALAELEFVFLTPGTDQCVEIHTPQSLNELAVRASQSGSGTKNVKSFSRLFYAKAQQCDIDGQGRLRIPTSLVKHAGLEKDVMIVGVGFNWEIWHPDHWQSYLQSHETAFDQIAQATFDSVLPTGSITEDQRTEHKTTEATKPSPK